MYREGTTARRAVHERLVFELFGIREQVRERVIASTRPEGQVDRPIRRGDEPFLYVTPLRYVSGTDAIYLLSAYCISISVRKQISEGMPLHELALLMHAQLRHIRNEHHAAVSRMWHLQGARVKWSRTASLFCPITYGGLQLARAGMSRDCRHACSELIKVMQGLISKEGAADMLQSCRSQNVVAEGLVRIGMSKSCGACRELIKLMQGTSKEGGAAMLRAWERQIDSETGALEVAVTRYKTAVADMKKRGEFAELAPARHMMLQWFEPLRDAIAREQRAVRATLQSSSRLARLYETMPSCPGTQLQALLCTASKVGDGLVRIIGMKWS